MYHEKIAVVTGSNKGIGFAIVKGLCERYQGKVYLTSRNVIKGKEAIKKLKNLGFQPFFHQLDITNQKSIDEFKDYLLKKHGGFDLLINNAGIAFLYDSKETIVQRAVETLEVNYFGLLHVSNTLIPILRENGRIVNISSSLGHLSKIPSADLRKKLSDSSLTVSNLTKLMEKFINDAKAGKNEEEGWGNSTYVVSKVGCSALTIILQKDLNNEKPYRNISVNCVHPGYVITDMTENTGDLTIDEGAIVPLYLALDNHGLKGKYIWKDKREVDWYGEKTPSKDQAI